MPQGTAHSILPPYYFRFLPIACTHIADDASNACDIEKDRKPLSVIPTFHVQSFCVATYRSPSSLLRMNWHWPIAEKLVASVKTNIRGPNVRSSRKKCVPQVRRTIFWRKQHYFNEKTRKYGNCTCFSSICVKFAGKLEELLVKLRHFLIDGAAACLTERKHGG